MWVDLFPPAVRSLEEQSSPSQSLTGQIDSDVTWWHPTSSLPPPSSLPLVFTCMEFSCRLRYRVLTDMLSGTSSRFCLVQMTRLAWLEQVQREGQEEAAPTSSGPGRRSRSSSWASRKRKGEGPGRQVSVAMRMATGTWPCSLIRRYRWGGSTLVDLQKKLRLRFGPPVATCSL